METAMRQTWAFLFRGYHITRRYIGWVIVFNFYALVTSATVALIEAGGPFPYRQDGATFQNRSSPTSVESFPACSRQS